MPHHENAPAFEATFNEDKNSFLETLFEAGNPFQENGNILIHIISRHTLHENAANPVRETTKIVKAQFEKFCCGKNTT